MALQTGSVSRNEMCASSSTKHANGALAADGAGARDSVKNCAATNCAVDGAFWLDGRCGAKAGGNSDQHACRLHVNRDARKSVFTLRIRVSTER
ncbi:hypothetical protein [Paraburkholderia phenoliruptrix]|uniref:hypothetical protein n=1 Tax=Paraburkholderia phenoliruptrix TaxID=252970 RepID=UPI0034CF1138